MPRHADAAAATTTIRHRMLSSPEKVEQARQRRLRWGLATTIRPRRQMGEKKRMGFEARKVDRRRPVALPLPGRAGVSIELLDPTAAYLTAADNVETQRHEVAQVGIRQHVHDVVERQGLP